MAEPEAAKSSSAFTELRDTLEDAIRRAYCEPVVEPVEGEDPEEVRTLARAALISNPRRMRHLAGIQAAAWEAVEARIEGGACPFCRVAASDPEGQIEAVVGDSIVITPLNPVVEGHKLVIPVTHVESAAEDPGVTGWAMRDTAVYLQRAGVGDCNIITSVGAAATQTVRHLHIHVIPRAEGDGLQLPWTDQP